MNRTQLTQATTLDALAKDLQRALTLCQEGTFSEAFITVRPQMQVSLGVNVNTQLPDVVIHLTMAQITDIITTFYNEQIAALVALGVTT